LVGLLAGAELGHDAPSVRSLATPTADLSSPHQGHYRAAAFGVLVVGSPAIRSKKKSAASASVPDHFESYHTIRLLIGYAAIHISP